LFGFHVVHHSLSAATNIRSVMRTRESNPAQRLNINCRYILMLSMNHGCHETPHRPHRPQI